MWDNTNVLYRFLCTLFIFCAIARGDEIQSPCAAFADVGKIKVPLFADHLKRPLSGQQAAWDPGRFSDPSHHNDSSFGYVVHAVLEPKERVRLHVSAPGEFVDVLADPTKLSEKTMISTSYINQEMRGTFGTSGFILSVPKENVFASDARDVGSPHLEQPMMPVDAASRALARLNQSHGLYTPEEIVQLYKEDYADQPGHYNEVVVRGKSPEGTQTTASAIFIMVGDMNRPLCSEERLKTLEDLSRKYKLPIVRIRQKP